MTPSPLAGSVAQQDDTGLESLDVEQVEAGIEFLREDHVLGRADSRVTVQVTGRTLEFAELFYGPIALEGADIIGHYSAAELGLLAGFFRAARELQERHLARVQDLPHPADLIS